MLPVLAAPVEVAAQVQPDLRALYNAAVADRRAGRHVQAVDRLQQVLAQRPEDVDARLNLGLSLLALGRADEAETAFRTVLQQAPDYADAEIGLARVAGMRGDNAAARDHAARADLLSPGRADIAGFRRGLEPAPWRFDVDVTQSRLSGDLPDWSETRFGASRDVGRDWNVAGAVERTERFGRTDVYLEGRLARRLSGGDVYVALGGTPDADYRPTAVILAGGSARLATGLQATLDASAARYPSGGVQTLHPGLAAGMFDDRLELAVRWINVWDETDQHRDGYAIRATWRVTDRFRLTAGLADAPESSEGVVADVSSTSLGAAFDLTDRLTVRVGGAAEDRGAYTRDDISFGLSARF